MKKKRRRRQLAILVPVASMADIAFLLIIFFMVCSRFAKDPGKEIEPPTTLEVSQLDDYPMVVLIDAKGTIFFQGRQVDGHEQIQEEVRRYVEGRTEDKSRTVIVRCDRTVLKHVFEPVYEAIAKGGGRIAAVGEKSNE
jgi:biopolymer transport protein ExbD